MTLLTGFLSGFSLVLWFVAIGLGLAVLCFVVISPWARLAPAWVRLSLGVVGMSMIAFPGGYLVGQHTCGDAREQLESLLSDLEAASERQKFLTKQSLDRLKAIQRLEGIAEDYQKELARGETSACPSDPVYNDRLRSILQQGSK